MDKLLAKNRQFIVLACPQMLWLRDKLAEKKPHLFIPGTVDWKFFPDGTPNIFIHDIDKIKNRHVLFLASHHSYEAKYTQLAVLYVLTRSKIRTLTVSLPFVDTATMERVSREGEVATADFDSWLLSSMPRFGSPVELIIFDLHTLQNRLYFHDGAIATMATGTNALKHRLIQLKATFPDEVIKIAFPDDGAQKRFGLSFAGYEQIVCKKVRDGDNRYVSIASGEPAGAHTIIVDDLVQSGGTLLECRAALQKAGASKVSAYVTHAIFPNDSWKKFIGTMEYFFITNSCPMAATVGGFAPFEVLSITDELMSHLLADPNG